MTPSRKMSKHLNGTWDAGQWDGCEPGTLNLPIQHAQFGQPGTPKFARVRRVFDFI